MLDRAGIVSLLVTSLALVLTLLLLRALTGGRLKKLAGYQKLVDILYGATILVFALVYLYIFGILSLMLSIAAALGIIGVIFGFAFINAWLANAVSGVVLAFDKTIDVGARIRMDGVEGVVAQISLTTTRVLTDDGKLLVIPNSCFRTRPYLVIEPPKHESKVSPDSRS